MTFFGPIPEPELDLDRIKQWVQHNLDTFHRSITFTGGDVTIDGTGSLSIGAPAPAGGLSQFFVHAPNSHVVLLESDAGDYPEKQFIIDINTEIGRLFWRESTGPTVHEKLRFYGPDHATNAHDIDLFGSVSSPGLRWDDSLTQWQFLDGSAATPAISFIATGQQDVGFFRAGTDEIGAAVGGVEVSTFTSAGLTQTPGAARWDRATAGTQTIGDASTTTVIYPDLVREDDVAGDFTMNTSTGVCTINRTGWYRVTAGVGWTFTFTGTVTSGTHDVLLFLLYGGTTNIGGNSGYFGSNATQFEVSTTFYFTATDTIQAQVRQETGANRTLAGSAATFFAIERLI